MARAKAKQTQAASLCYSEAQVWDTIIYAREESTTWNTVTKDDITYHWTLHICSILETSILYTFFSIMLNLAKEFGRERIQISLSWKGRLNLHIQANSFWSTTISFPKEPRKIAPESSASAHPEINRTAIRFPALERTIGNKKGQRLLIQAEILQSSADSHCFDHLILMSCS